jgi:anti-anti-sigma factor
MSTPARHRVSQATTPLVEIVVTEELTAPAAARLHALLVDALALRPLEVIVDLGSCPRADALAVDVLLNAHRRAIHLGSRVVLRAPSQRLRRVLHLGNLDHVFNIDDAPSSGPPLLRRHLGPADAAGEGR